MNEFDIMDALKRWAKPDEDFFEDLLQRCLTVIDQNYSRELNDAELEGLAAAGDSVIRTIPPSSI